jgi:hypothetical protein
VRCGLHFGFYRNRDPSNGIGDDGSEQEQAAFAIPGGCSPELKKNILPEERLPLEKSANSCTSTSNRNSAPAIDRSHLHGAPSNLPALSAAPGSGGVELATASRSG